MPLIYQKIWSHDNTLAVWKIEENEDYFIEKLDWTSDERQYFDSLKGNRRIEWLSSRLLTCQLSNISNTSFIIKDEFGKPRIKDSQINISISHTKGYVAIYISPKNIGIDIQNIVSKIHRIAHKYLFVNELHAIPEEKLIDSLHIYWGAKESLYKAYGRRELKYREHIRIDINHVLECQESLESIYPFTFTGYVMKDSYYEEFKLRALKIDGTLLVYGESQA